MPRMLPDSVPAKDKSLFRALRLPDQVISVLKEHYDRYSSLDGFSTDWRICGGASCVRDTTAENRNKEYARLARKKKIKIHEIRHSQASVLANEGINIQEAARLLGHAKIEETLRTYAHLYPREEERAVQILNKIV